MHLSISFALKLARSVGASLAMLAALTFVGGVVLTPVAAQVTPLPSTPHPRPPLSPYAQSALAAIRAPLDKLTPVTDEMLRNPPPGDWLHWRRTYDGWAYSPLTQINRKNVKDLKVAWTFSMASTTEAVNEFTPLVHDGVLFLWNFGETIQALDAKTGTLLWQFDYSLPSDYPALPGFYLTKRSLAIAGNKLIFPTIDMHVIALDVKTGRRCGISLPMTTRASVPITAVRWSSKTK
jgi:alcohol dehydrogenase (cytochrome c)